MTRKAKIVASALTLIGLGTLSAADAVLTMDNAPFLALFEQKEPASTSSSFSSASSVIASSQSSAQSSGVNKAKGPDVTGTIAALGLTAGQTNDPLFLPKVIDSTEGSVQTAVLLQDGDRAGLIAWSESAGVKIAFLALKEALHRSFTPAIADLIDETQQREGFPPRNFLSFIDTGISEERIAFARVRERLYEIHIAPGKDDVMFRLLDELSR